MIRIGKISFYLTAFLLFCIALYVLALPVAYDDKTYELLYARMWLGGRQLYTDLFPVSPPLIFWMYSVPQMLALHLPFLSDLRALFLVGLCLIGFSFFISLRLMMLHPAFAGSRQKLWEFTLLFFFVLLFRANAHYFLDRDHLTIVLAFPYLLRQMPSLQHAPLPKWLRVTLSVMAAAGFCMRPQWLLVLGGVLMLSLWRERSWRVLFSLESCVIYFTGLAYLLAVWVIYPVYFTVVMRMALATYSATRDNAPSFAYSSNAIYILIGTFIFFPWKLTSPYRRDIYYLLALCPFFWLFALSGNNWAYEYFPLSSMALVTTVFVLWELLYLRRERKLQGHTARLFELGIAACALTVLIRIVISLLYFQLLIFHGCYDVPQCEGDEPYLEEVKGKNGVPLSFGAISIDFSRWTHLCRYGGAEWLTRFPQLWMLPQLLLDDEPTLRKHTWIVAYVGNAFAEDLNRRKPEVMFVDVTNYFYSAEVQLDLVSYFSVVPAFAEAWKHYKLLHTIDLCPSGMHYTMKCKYDVYRRND